MISSSDRRAFSMHRILLAICLVSLLAPNAIAQDWTVDWHTIDGGGVLESETADGQWQLSGTIGQWDATASQALSASGVRLTGGFWSFLVNPIDAIFRDRFEATLTPRRSETDSERDI